MRRKAFAFLLVLFAMTTVVFAQSITEVSNPGTTEVENTVVVETEAVAEEPVIDRSALENPVTLLDQFSYVLGYAVGADYFYMYQYYYYPEAEDYFGMLGAYDAQMGQSIYSDEEMNNIIVAYEEDFAIRKEQQAVDNLAVAENFLSENAKQEGVYTTESGLQYMIITQGEGNKPQRSDTVELDYQLTLLDGSVIDSSYLRGEHASFALNSVIEGFAEGVCLMPIGSHYKFFIHPNLGYGDVYMSSMAPNSLLIFEVQTYSIVTE